MDTNHAVTRVTIILDKPTDWHNWLFIRKDSCRRYDLWQYVDPDKSKDQIPDLKEPLEPRVTDYLETATSLASLKLDDRNSFRWDYERFERKLLDYQRKVQALADFNLEISKTISPRRIYLIQGCDTAHDRLIALKKHLAPDAATRRHELADKYNLLKTAPTSMKKVEHWLSEWTQITTMGKSINLPETDGIRPQEDFLVACKAIDPEYATTCLRDVYKAENSNTINLLPTLDNYVAEFTAFLRRNKPSTDLTTAAAELRMTKSFEDKSNSTNKNRRNGKPVPKCICGSKHWYADCFIINDEHPNRPSDFKPSQNAMKLVTAARNDPKIETRVRNALERWKKRQLKNDILEIDDGLPPANNETYTVNIDNMLDNKKTNEPSQRPDDQGFNALPIDGKDELAIDLTALALDHGNELLTRWIVDPGSNTHVINSSLWKGWKFERQNTEGRSISAGKSRTLITAWGSVDIVAHGPQGFQTLRLTHVALVEGFLTSVLGLARCRSEGIHFDSGRDLLYKHQPERVIAKLEYNGGHWLIDADPSRRPCLSDFSERLNNFGISYRPSYVPKPTNIIDRQRAHQIWGHPSKRAIEHLEEHVNGVSLVGGKIQDCSCQACQEARLTKIISRRPGENKAIKPFYRIGIDIVYIVPMSDECWNGDKYMLHAVDEYTKWHEVSTVRNKTKFVLMSWIKSVIRKIQRNFNFDVCVIRSDNEQGFGNDLIQLCNELGIRFEPAVKGTPEQNGLAERAGGTLTMKARVMRIHGNLPKSLANELFKTAGYILNRTPTESLNWKTPYEMVWERKPLVSHMRPIGCQAFTLNQHILKGDKTASRALIGHLVGYQGTNIFRIWLPNKDDVIVTRDVVFEPTIFYTGTQKYAADSVIKQTIELLEYPERLDDGFIEIEDLLTRRQRWSELGIKSEVEPGIQKLGSVLLETTEDSELVNSRHDPSKKGSSNEEIQNPDTERTEVVSLDNQPIPEGYRAYGEPAPNEINLNPTDTSLIITGKRQQKKAPNPNVFAISSYASILGPALVSNYIHTFAVEVLKPVESNEIPRIHQSRLPSPLKTVKSLKSHAFGKWFQRALHNEWKSLCIKGCFRQTEKTKMTADAEVLPLMWVFSYKTTEDGYLASFKARLVVRGDLQQPLEDTYAATLAIRNFRAIISIANYFDWEMEQYDVPTAFLNAKINRKLYAEVPDGVQDNIGSILEVQLALYGLKESPLLWYEELKKALIKLGLRSVPGFPCLYINAWLILFVYVDDIVMAFHRTNMHLHLDMEQKLKDLYDLKVLGDIAWFLGIRVIRDRQIHKTWLVQDAFIDKVCGRFGIESTGKFPDVPLTDNWLPQSSEEPDLARTKLYQQLVGSLAYIAVWGRPDVARTHVVFACHLTNPGQTHISKIKQTWRYLLGTKAYALEASKNTGGPTEYITDNTAYKDPLFFGSSDASYADEPETRRSSQGYLFKFGGMAIDWKSMVQRTVTKSTTESELLSLSMAGSQMQEWLRFFDGISLKLNSRPTIWCDNQQTVGIVTKSQDKLHTKVKHVDIHQLWIRQEVESARLDVKWVPTENMPADGLTKILPRQKFAEFVKQLGLVNIATRINRNKTDPNSDVNILFPNRG